MTNDDRGSFYISRATVIFMPEIPICTTKEQFKYWQGGRDHTIFTFCGDCDPSWQAEKEKQGKCSLAIAKQKAKEV